MGSIDTRLKGQSIVIENQNLIIVDLRKQIELSDDCLAAARMLNVELINRLAATEQPPAPALPEEHCVKATLTEQLRQAKKQLEIYWRSRLKWKPPPRRS